MTTDVVNDQALGRLQEWFQAAIVDPDGVSVADAELILTRSKALSACDRLAVYEHAYFARLLDCLREEYPVLKAALGDEVFDGFAVEYLRRFPSRSYTLFELGTRFPRFLHDTRPADAAADGEPSWPDFLIDLATLELAFNEVFDGPGIEGKPILDAGAVAAVSPDRLPGVRLIPAPCVRVFAFRYPVHTYFAAVRRGEDAPLPDPEETFLAVTRQRYFVKHFELSKPAHALLSSLLRGETLGTAIAAAVTDAGTDDLTFRLGEWFRDWAEQGFFVGIADGSSADLPDL